MVMQIGREDRVPVIRAPHRLGGVNAQIFHGQLDAAIKSAQARLYAKFRGSNGCHHVGTPPLMAGVGGFFTIRCQH